MRVLCNFIVRGWKVIHPGADARLLHLVKPANVSLFSLLVHNMSDTLCGARTTASEMMASHRHQRRRPVLTFVVAVSLIHSSISFVPPSAVTIAANRPVPARGMCGVTSASRGRSRARLCLTHPTSASALRAASSAAENDGGVNGDDNDDIDQLVGIDEFRVEKAERDREEAEEAAATAAAAAVAAAPEAAGAAAVGKGVGLGLEGAIFPSDAFPGSPGTDDITLQGVQLESGQPKEMVGFWKVCVG